MPFKIPVHSDNLSSYPLFISYCVVKGPYKPVLQPSLLRKDMS